MQSNKRTQIAWLLCLSLISGCGLMKTSTPTMQPVLSQGSVTILAIKACSKGHVSQVDPPHLVEMNSMSWEEATARIECSGTCADTTPPPPGAADRLAWLVTLEGNWLVAGGPQATATPIGQKESPTSTPVNLTRCLVVIDARSGDAGPLIMKR